VKRNKITAIDVGTTKVCTIIADNSGAAGFRVLGVGITPSHGVHRGLVVNIKEARESIRESVSRAEQIAGSKIESAMVGVTGQHIMSTNNQAAVAITRRKQIVHPEDLKRVTMVASSIEIPGERELLHVIPRNYKIDGQEGIDNPVGMHGFRLDVETHIVTAAKTSVQNLTKCINSLDINIDGLVLDHLASAEAVLTEDEKHTGVMMADIGGGITDIAIFNGGTAYHTSLLPVSGYQVTHDISIALQLPFELAEKIKRKHGSVASNLNIWQGDKALNQDGYSVSYKELSEVIRVRVEELLRLIMLELPDQDRHKLIPSGLVLTGGCANLPGIVELAETVIHLSVRVGMPARLDGVSDVLQDPACATGVGLLLWQAKKRDKQDWRTREKTENRFVNRIAQLLHQ
jgi:cell division protein FtsA